MGSDRTVDLAVEVAADPDEVWHAVATGPGRSAWLQPTRLQPRVGGEYAFDMGGGWNTTGTVTAHDEPRHVATETSWSVAGGGRTVATDWRIEPRTADTTALRMTMSGFGSGQTWDAEIAALTEGMTTALRVLELYLRHFSGMRGTDVQAIGPTGDDLDHERAHARFLATVGIVAPRLPLRTFDGVPELVGTCRERRAGTHHSAALLLLDAPAPGIGTLATIGTPPVHEVHLTFYGPDAGPAAEAQSRAWERWLAGKGKPKRTVTPGE